MINLLNTTFIIPIYIDSLDRINNIESVIGYLDYNFRTNVIIHELVGDSCLFLRGYDNLNIVHIREDFTGEFHRTRQLNKMLSLVKTPVVSNYDIDVILPIESYVLSEKIILDGDHDVVYPYGVGDFQRKIPLSLDRYQFNCTFDLDSISDFILDRSDCGHCFFIRANEYKRFGGENENFIAYGPEDSERINRFSKFGSVHRIENFVYHFEHSRTNFSTMSNPHFSNNLELFNKLKDMDKYDLVEYYSSLSYIEEYGFNLIKSSDL